MRLSRCEFYENRGSEKPALLTGVNEMLSFFLHFFIYA
jgi:hypothetical protein